MKGFVTVACIMLSAFVGVPCAALGASGLAGALADTSHAENVRFGASLFAIAGLILVPSLLWFWWRFHQRA